MMAGIDTAAALAIGLFMLVGFALTLFMAAVQPIWCVIDCAVATRRTAFGKGVWIILLIVLYGMANWFYGAFAAEGRWLLRLTRLAWIFAFLLLAGFIAMYNMSDGFRRGMDQQWQRGRDLVVMVDPGARA